MDIKTCYDSISQTKLYDIIKEALGFAEEYWSRRYAMVVQSGGRLKRVFLRSVTKLEDYCYNFTKFIKRKIVEKGYRKAVFVNQVSLPSTI